MNLSQQAQTAIESALQRALEKYSSGGEQRVVTDLYIQPNPTTGKFCIFNDEERELAAVAEIKEWFKEEEEDFYDSIEKDLRNLLNQCKERGELERLTILKPYSFVLVDEKRESVAELLLMDDDTILLNNNLLDGLDQELDDFLKELLEQ